MAVDKDFLLDLSPEFASVDAGRIDRLVLLATIQVPPLVWGLKADLAVALLVAHMITAGDQSGKGSIASESLGDITRTFSKSSSGAAGDGLGSTTWGAQYRALCRTLTRGPLVT